jgi:hypothetical protein
MERHIDEGEAVLERAAAEIAAAPRRLRDSVRHFVRAMVDFHAHERALHRVLFEEAPLPPRVRHMLGELEERITDRVQALLCESPEVAVADSRLAATIVVQTVEALTHKLVVHGERDIDLDAYVDEVVRLVERYVTAAG